MTAGLRPCIEAAVDAVEAARDELGRLDAVAGDGDHGVTMAVGARAVRRTLADFPDVDGADLLAKVALAMSSIGGAIGPIYASALLKAAATVRTLAATTGAPTVEQLRACAEAAELAISGLGGAKPGDKTILDALHPMVEELRRAEAAGTGTLEAMGAAAAAAREGAASTADLIALIGRASRLGERSRGSADAGATSLALIVDAAVQEYARSSLTESPA
jgi:dihydroxyacetone kinase-like protein